MLRTCHFSECLRQEQKGTAETALVNLQPRDSEGGNAASKSMFV